MNKKEKLKEFSIMRMYHGIQLEYHVLAKTKKEAINLFDISLYQINTYGYSYEPRTQGCIDNPRKMYAKFDSGEMRYAKPELWNIVIPSEEMEEIIREHRKICPTYKHTLDKYDK